MRPPATDDLSCLLQSFFRSYLINQRRVSQHTVSAYRDTFRILLPFLAGLLKKNISALELADLNTKHVIAYLSHLEEDRGNSIATRNARLAAIRAFFNYVAIEVPEALPDIKRVPLWRFPKKERTGQCLSAWIESKLTHYWRHQINPVGVAIEIMFYCWQCTIQVPAYQKPSVYAGRIWISNGSIQFIFMVKGVKKGSFHCGKKRPPHYANG